jgi:hypothetical protein
MNSTDETTKQCREPDGISPTPRLESGVDDTLIRWMLSLTPAQRLHQLVKHTAAVTALRNARPAA